MKDVKNDAPPRDDANDDARLSNTRTKEALEISPNVKDMKTILRLETPML